MYKTVQTNLETWLVLARETEDGDGVPVHVERDFRVFLDCGILARGFARARCGQCGHDFLVAFSCRGRGVCPSCLTRRMAEVAAHLVDHVIPLEPTRQWVLSVPKRVRFFLRRDPRVASAVLRVFLRAVESMLRRRSPGAPNTARAGGVAFRQRAGSAINDHYHYHAVLLDGVYAEGESGEAVFYQATDLSEQDVAAVTETVRKRTLHVLARRGLLDRVDARDMLQWEHHGGFSVDASIHLAASDRAGLERLLRYCARPPFASERLGRLNEQTLVYDLKQHDVDGRTSIYLSPMEFLDRLAKVIPPPRIHRHTYWGVLAPNAPLRTRIVSCAAPAAAVAARIRQAAEAMALPIATALSLPDPPSGSSTGLLSGSSTGLPATPSTPGRGGAASGGGGASGAGGGAEGDRTSHRKRRGGFAAGYAWALLLARIYEVLPLVCARCGSAMSITAFITDPQSVTRVLDHIGEPSLPPSVSPARDHNLFAEQDLFAHDQGPDPPADSPNRASMVGNEIRSGRLGAPKGCAATRGAAG